MESWTKYVLVTLVVGVVGFFVSPMLFHSDEIVPTAAQLPFFMALTAIESLALGFGVAFMIFNWAPAKASFWAISWWLVSWWPHDGLHMVNGLDPSGLLLIEYGFHVTLILTAVIVALDWMKQKA